MTAAPPADPSADPTSRPAPYPSPGQAAPLPRPVTDDDRADAEILWRYHRLGHDLEPCDLGLGLGSHDPVVADTAAGLYRRGLFPLLLFSGRINPTFPDRFPRGEAAHFAERAMAHGVPAGSIRREPHAANTGENIRYSRALLQAEGRSPATVLLISLPYMERRAYATCRKQWPEITPRCAGEQIAFPDYLARIGDDRLILDHLVGNTQRIVRYPQRGFAIEQPMPPDVATACARLLARGFGDPARPTGPGA